MPIILSSAVRPSAPVEFAVGRFMSWTGWDGSVWELSHPTRSTPGMTAGVSGLHMPKMRVFRSATPLVPGSELLGYSIEDRSVYWPLVFQAWSEEEWHEAYSGFFDSIHPMNPGIWTVGTGRDARTLPLTGVFDDNYTFDRDPFVTGFALIGVELVATRPLWRGAQLSQRFENSAGVPFIDPVNASPPFTISNGSTFSVAEVENPGDEPAYPTYTLEGPLDDVQIGFGDARIEVPFPIADGKTLVIDTDPASRFATLDGVDVTRELGFQMFAPVPPKGTTPLTIVAVGEGAVTAAVTPLFWRAF